MTRLKIIPNYCWKAVNLPCKNVWGTLCSKGFGGLFCFEGTVTEEKYLTLLDHSIRGLYDNTRFTTNKMAPGFTVVKFRKKFNIFKIRIYIVKYLFIIVEAQTNIIKHFSANIIKHFSDVSQVVSICDLNRKKVRASHNKWRSQTSTFLSLSTVV